MQMPTCGQTDLSQLSRSRWRVFSSATRLDAVGRAGDGAERRWRCLMGLLRERGRGVGVMQVDWGRLRGFYLSLGVFLFSSAMELLRCQRVNAMLSSEQGLASWCEYRSRPGVCQGNDGYAGSGCLAWVAGWYISENMHMIISTKTPVRTPLTL